MVKVDMLYQTDQQLKEIMLSEERFGGISVILLGNILQLSQFEEKMYLTNLHQINGSLAIS